MRTQLPFVPALLFRWLIVAALLLTTAGQTLLAPVATAQDNAAADPVDQIAALVPGDATVFAALSTNPDSVQWPLAADLLARGGLEDLVYGLIAQAMREADLTSANLIPGQSKVLGGSIALAGWGEASNPLERGVVYIVASDPEAAYRSVVAQLLTETGEQTTEAEVPGGRLTMDEGGFTGVMLINGVVVVSDQEALTTVWQLITGAGPTLADFGPFAEVIAAQDPTSIARVYLNGPGIGQGLLPLVGNFAGLGWQEALLLSPFAAQAASYVSLGLTAAEDGFHLRAVQLPAPLIGQTMPTDAPSTDLAARISADADLFVAGTDLGANPIVVQYLDSIVFGATVGSGFTEYDPGGPTTVDDAYDDLAQATGIDIRADILDQLRGDFVFAIAPATVGGSQSADAVLVSEVADREAMRDTLNQIVGALRLVIAGQGEEAQLTEETVGDDTLYVITSLDDVPNSDSISFGLIGDELVIAFWNGFERLFDPEDGATLSTDSRYLDALAAASDEDGQILYLDAHDLFALASVESIPPPNSSVPRGGSQNASIDGIQAFAAVTYDDGDLAITDAVLTIDEGSTAPAERETPAAPEIPADATPQASNLEGAFADFRGQVGDLVYVLVRG